MLSRIIWAVIAVAIFCPNANATPVYVIENPYRYEMIQSLYSWHDEDDPSIYKVSSGIETNTESLDEELVLYENYNYGHVTANRFSIFAKYKQPAHS